ncbi:MAG: arsenate reductase [Chitinophagales bacterium]|jgi:arsenate reductase
MSKLAVLHNNRCSKSRNALSLLDGKGIDYEVISYLDGVLKLEGLRSLLKKLNLKPQDIVRKGEAIFKEQFKGKELSDEEWLQALVDYPKLIERPIVYDAKSAVVGRPIENIENFIENRK